MHVSHHREDGYLESVSPMNDINIDAGSLVDEIQNMTGELPAKASQLSFSQNETNE